MRTKVKGDPAASSLRATPESFARRVLSILSRVPVGRVVTYGGLAELAGYPRAARAVGTLMRTAGRPGLPYHRVIAAGGRLGGYGGNLDLKASLLRAEGVIVRGTRIVDFRSREWPPREPTARRAQSPRRKTRRDSWEDRYEKTTL